MSWVGVLWYNIPAQLTWHTVWLCWSQLNSFVCCLFPVFRIYQCVLLSSVSVAARVAGWRLVCRYVMSTNAQCHTMNRVRFDEFHVD